MAARQEISDETWAVLAPLFPEWGDEDQFAILRREWDATREGSPVAG